MKDILTKRLKKHDEAALEEVMQRYTPLVASIVYGIAGRQLPKEDIEETIADIFVTLWQNADKIIEGKLQGYLCRIARTRTLNRLYQCRKPPALDLDEWDTESDFSMEITAENADIAAVLRELLDQLPEQDREIMLRYYYFRQTARYIAEQLGMNKETVKSRLHRTKEKLRILLTERGYAP